MGYWEVHATLKEIEDDIAICSVDKSHAIEISKDLLPENAKIGDRLLINGGDVSICDEEYVQQELPDIVPVKK